MDLIETLIKEVPDLKFALSSNVLKGGFLADASEPFSSDEEYMEFVCSYISIKEQAKNSQDVLRNQTSVPQSPNDKLDYNPQDALIKAYAKLLAAMDSRRASRLAATPAPRLPRIIRLCKKFEFSEVETRLFEAIASKDMMNSFSGGYIGSDILSLSRIAGLSWKDIFHFLDKTRPHIKQNMFEYFDLERPLQSSVTLLSTITAALYGHKLKDDDLLRIDGTMLAVVLSEESGGSPSDGDAGTAPAEVSSSLATPSDKKGDDEKSDDEDVKPVPIGEEEEVRDISSVLKQLSSSTDALPPPPPTEDEDIDNVDESKLTPYHSDLDYLEAQIDYLFAVVQLAELKKEEDHSQVFGGWRATQNSENEQKVRHLQAKERVARGKAQKRLELTKAQSKWLPRLERMVKARNLDSFEREVLLTLIAAHISPKFHAIGHRNGMEVGALLRCFSKNFQEQVTNRKYFYKGSTLIKEGMARLQGGSFDTDLNSFYAAVDRRMLDFSMGLDTEFSELVEGSHLYFPKVDIENVILADEQKRLILETVSNFEEFKRARRRVGFDEKVTYGSGIVMLFFGASGTGKTMMANAIGNHLQKRILLINFPSLGTFSGDENLKWIFREAKINDAILFFDECESIFQSRENGNHAVNLLLTEFERHDGLVILATNRAFDLDEAMHRRVTIAVEFNKPDPILREKIWRSNIPKGLKLAEDVDLKGLALQFELTGGFIKNALLSALSIAVARDGEDKCTINHADLVKGCKLQLRGRLRMVDFHRRIVPTRGLDDLILSKEKVKILEDIVMFEKARQVLFSQWGFDKTMGNDRGTSVLLYGPPGTGKTMACEAIAFTMGRPLKVINSAELLSKWVGDTPKNIDAVFEEAKLHDAVLMFDEADGLFGARSTSSESSTDRYANVDVSLLLYHIERFPGVVVLATNQISVIDNAFFRRIKFVIEFPNPEATERARLWRALIPKEAPLADDVDFKKLGQLFEFSGGHIQSCVIRAASRAALRPKEEERKLTMALLTEACNEERDKQKHNFSASGKSMYA